MQISPFCEQSAQDSPQDVFDSAVHWPPSPQWRMLFGHWQAPLMQISPLSTQFAQDCPQAVSDSATQALPLQWSIESGQIHAPLEHTSFRSVQSTHAEPQCVSDSWRQTTSLGHCERSVAQMRLDTESLYCDLFAFVSESSHEMNITELVMKQNTAIWRRNDIAWRQNIAKISVFGSQKAYMS